jgi:hypothetical protein
MGFFYSLLFGRKKSIHGFLLNGKRKMSFSLSSQINNLLRKSLIWAPLNGRFDDFFQSHQCCYGRNKFVSDLLLLGK